MGSRLPFIGVHNFWGVPWNHPLRSSEFWDPFFLNPLVQKMPKTETLVPKRHPVWRQRPNLLVVSCCRIPPSRRSIRPWGFPGGEMTGLVKSGNSKWQEMPALLQQKRSKWLDENSQKSSRGNTSLGDGVILFHPCLGKWANLTRILSFKWVETTKKRWFRIKGIPLKDGLLFQYRGWRKYNDLPSWI